MFPMASSYLTDLLVCSPALPPDQSLVLINFSLTQLKEQTLALNTA
jgi:hypothetical protein